MPARPSISTRHSRQEPKASTMSVAQSFGICVPISIAARMIEVPSGTVTAWPSMVSVTVFSRLGRRRAVVDLMDERHGVLLIPRPADARRRAEIFREMGERAHHRIGREAAERAERAEFHGVAEVFQHARDSWPGPRRAMIRSIVSTPRVEPIRHGVHLPQRFDGAELHREARLLRHVDGVVEHHDAAMADQAVAGGKGLVVERRVEQRRAGNRRRAGRRPAPRAPAGR